MTSVPGGHLLLLKDGGVWGVDNRAVLGVGRQETQYRIQVYSDQGGRELVADEVLGVVEGLVVVPAPAAVRRFWPQAFTGLAVHGGAPIVLLDPGDPPPWLTWKEGDSRDG